MWHYSQATVTDQNSWHVAGEAYIAQKYPNWVNVFPDNYYSEQDAEKAITVGESILTSYPDIDGIICNDSTALPGQAQAAQNLGLDATKVSISKTGLVQVTQSGQPTPTTVGQIELANFFNEAGLEAIGDNLLLETAASGPAIVGTPGDVGFGQIMQAYTEASNVDAVTEISDLIVAQRAYEMNSKVISTADQMLSVTSQIKS